MPRSGHPSRVVRLAATLIVLASLLSLWATTAMAQQPKDSASATKHPTAMLTPPDSATMSGFFGSMVPMQIRIVTMGLEATWATLAKPENAAHLADFTKNYYDALIARGFTKDQALAIVMSIGIPHPVPGR